MSGKIIMIGSMKGGVSKTVTTFNLAYSLSKLGRKVLAVDFDSQANLSTCYEVQELQESCKCPECRKANDSD